MTFQKSLFSCKMACFRDGFSVPHHGCVLTGHFPVAWTYSLQWVNFSRDYLCIAPLLRDTSQTQPSYRRAQITCYKTGPVQWNPKGEWDSLVLGWTGWQKVLGQGVSINCQTAAGNSCCHASSHTRAGAPVGPVGWDTGVCRCHCRGLLSVLTHQQLQLCYFCPARLAWFTHDLTHPWPLPEGKCDGNTKNLGSPTWDNRRQCSLPGARGC